MVIACISGSLVSNHNTKRRQNPEDLHLNLHHHESLNSSIKLVTNANFVNSPYYYESELGECAVTVCFSKYLPWQMIHFLQRSNQFSKSCCRPLIVLLPRSSIFVIVKAQKSYGTTSELNSVLDLEKLAHWNPI
jgi:hypothetical protein